MSLNKVMLIGNLGADADCKVLNDGNIVANFSLATTERWRDAQGNRQEATEWHRVSAWNALARVVQQYTRKGSRVYVEGVLKHRKYERDGATHYATEVVAHSVVLLDKPSHDA